MPTYFDPVADAGDTAAALEAFAHSVRMFADPADMYPAMLDLDASLHALNSVLRQLAKPVAQR
jgi:hypothetical protein